MNKEIWVNRLTEPSKLATSLLFGIEENRKMRCVAIGMEAIAVLAKSLGYLNLYNKTSKQILFIPRMEYVETEQGVRNAMVWEVS